MILTDHISLNQAATDVYQVELGSPLLQRNNPSVAIGPSGMIITKSKDGTISFQNSEGDSLAPSELEPKDLERLGEDTLLFSDPQRLIFGNKKKGFIIYEPFLSRFGFPDSPPIESLVFKTTSLPGILYQLTVTQMMIMSVFELMATAIFIFQPQLKTTTQSGAGRPEKNFLINQKMSKSIEIVNARFFLIQIKRQAKERLFVTRSGWI